MKQPIKRQYKLNGPQINYKLGCHRQIRKPPKPRHQNQDQPEKYKNETASPEFAAHFTAIRVPLSLSYKYPINRNQLI